MIFSLMFVISSQFELKMKNESLPDYEDLFMGFREAIRKTLGEDISAKDIARWFQKKHKEIKATPNIPEKKKTLEQLIDCLKDKNENIRKRAAEILSVFWEEKGIKALIGVINDENGHNVAMESLVRIGHRAVPFLGETLKDENKDVRRRAAEALGKIGQGAEEAAPALIQSALKDKDKDVRKNAAYALGLTGPKAEKAILRSVVTALIQALKDKNEDVRRGATWALGEIGPKAEEAAPALIQSALKDKNPSVRYNAAEALGKIGQGAEKAVPVFIKALKDKNVGVREAAQAALFKIQKK
jgi:HEAT repeat protein